MCVCASSKTPMFPTGYNLATRGRRAAGPRALTDSGSRAAARQVLALPRIHIGELCGAAAILFCLLSIHHNHFSLIEATLRLKAASSYGGRKKTFGSID